MSNPDIRIDTPTCGAPDTLDLATRHRSRAAGGSISIAEGHAVGGPAACQAKDRQGMSE